MRKRKELRSGYTTGACAAAAAKAAAMLLFQNTEHRTQNTEAPTHPSPFKGEGKGGGDGLSSDFWHLTSEVEIPFPDGSRVSFKVHNSKLKTHNSNPMAFASVIKDAGDDPDVTNGAEIMAETKFINGQKDYIVIKGGAGVGIATKPGLPVAVGEAAINPVPRKMIRDAVMEVLQPSAFSLQQGGDSPRNPPIPPLAKGGEGGFVESGLSPTSAIEITISVVNGEELAKKTINSRLGIIGGISILGTTGIVKPISSEAWTATITSSMDVAKAMGCNEIVLSAGRASEKAHMGKYNLSEESYVMMGDYLEFSLLEAKRHEFKKIHLCAQWAKMLKIAMATPQTHVRHGAIDIKRAVEFLKNLGHGSWVMGHEFNTAREIFDFINFTIHIPQSAFSDVCNTAKKYAEGIAGIPVITHLISYEGEIIASSE